MKYIDPTGMFNVETGEVEEGDTLESITGILNDEYGISLTESKVAEVNGIEDDLEIGSFIILPQTALVLIFDNEYLKAYDVNYMTYFSDLVWEAVSGIDGKYPPIAEGLWRIDPSRTEYFPTGAAAWVEFWKQSLPNSGMWRGGREAWGNVRTQLENLETGEYHTGYYIHGGDYPGSAGCIDLTYDNDDFHQWFTNDWGKGIDVIVDYSASDRLFKYIVDHNL